MAHLFVVFTVSLEELKFLHLLKSNSSFVSFYESCFWCCYLKKPLPKPRSQRFFLMFSSRSLLILSFTFRSMINFKLIFMYCTRHKLKFFPFFFFLHMDIHLLQHHLLKRLSPSIALPLHYCGK